MKRSIVTVQGHCTVGSKTAESHEVPLMAIDRHG